MGPAYFVIAILGCADGGAQCTPVATLQTRYESEQQCSAATTSALEANTEFNFPTIVAQCRPGEANAAASADKPSAIPASARRG